MNMPSALISAQSQSPYVSVGSQSEAPVESAGSEFTENYTHHINSTAPNSSLSSAQRIYAALRVGVRDRPTLALVISRCYKLYLPTIQNVVWNQDKIIYKTHATLVAQSLQQFGRHSAPTQYEQIVLLPSLVQRCVSARACRDQGWGRRLVTGNYFYYGQRSDLSVAENFQLDLMYSSLQWASEAGCVVSSAKSFCISTLLTADHSMRCLWRISLPQLFHDDTDTTITFGITSTCGISVCKTADEIFTVKDGHLPTFPNADQHTTGETMEVILMLAVSSFISESLHKTLTMFK